MMILGDNMFNMDLGKLIENFYSNQASSTILLHKVNNPGEFGVAVVDDKGCIIGLAEKPKEFISDLIITGIYLFGPSIFPAIEKITPSGRGELEITDAIQKQLEMGGRVTYELIQGWWKDTGKLEDILEANRLVLDEIENKYCFISDCASSISGKVKASDNVVVKDSIIHGPVHIDEDVLIINSCIGPYTSIGKGSIIKECEIDNSIVLENTHLESVSKRITSSLIGKNVSIKRKTNRPFSNSFFVGDDSEISL